MRRNDIPCQTMEALVVVNEYQDGVLSGILRHPRLEGPLPIQSISHLLLTIDSLLDLEGCPGSPLPLVKPIPPQEHVTATLQIQVLYKELNTWKGRLVWLEGKQAASFSSVLELMQLLDEILGN